MKTTEYLDRKFASGKPRKCWMCQCELNRYTASVDHLWPKKLKGKDCADNYRLACMPCNSSRGATPLSRKAIDALKGKEHKKSKDYSALAEAIKRQHANNRQQSSTTEPTQSAPRAGGDTEK